MKNVYDFLKSAGVYFLATVEDNKPRVRPFGTIDIFEDKLYIQTGKVKQVSKQMHMNSNVELCAFKDGKWIRLSGEVEVDDRREAKKHMLDNYPELRNMYNEDDGNTEVWYFKNGEAIISSFTEAPVVIKL